ncbi:hypothetical protein QQ045_014735 [Rhodiola kirilowii]
MQILIVLLNACITINSHMNNTGNNSITGVDNHYRRKRENRFGDGGKSQGLAADGERIKLVAKEGERGSLWSVLSGFEGMVGGCFGCLKAASAALTATLKLSLRHVAWWVPDLGVHGVTFGCFLSSILTPLHRVRRRLPPLVGPAVPPPVPFVWS